MNNKILNKRWREVDKLLSTFYAKNMKIDKNFRNELQMLFDGITYTYEDLYKYASIKEINKLKIKVDNIREKYGLQGYSGYMLKGMSNRKKMRYIEVLLGLITSEYYIKYVEQTELENSLFNDVAEEVYKSTQLETNEVLNPKKKVRLLTVPEAFLLQLIGMNNFNGVKWQDYKEGNVTYNARNLLDKVKVNMQLEKPIEIDGDILKLLDKQERAYLNKKKDRDKVYEDYRNEMYISEYSGMLDNQICFLANQFALAGMKVQGCKKVQFIATVDDHTTDMCRSLDGQIFSIDEMNVYQRYSKLDDKNVVYHTKGLEVGANLPPINNGFHYCRSTIYPVK